MVALRCDPRTLLLAVMVTFTLAVTGSAIPAPARPPSLPSNSWSVEQLAFKDNDALQLLTDLRGRGRQELSLGMIEPVRPGLLLDPRRWHGGLHQDADVAVVDGRTSSSASASSGVETNATSAADPYRLPSILVPTYYAWTLTPHLSGNFTFDGMVDIYFNVLEDTANIVLHSKELSYVSDDCGVYHTDDYGMTEIVASVLTIAFDPVRETANLSLSTSLRAGKRYSLQVAAFTGRLNDDLHGFYRHSYMSNGQTRWLAATRFESGGARRAFPCFDEPEYIARYDITIVLDANMTAISNMPSAKEQAGDSGQVQKTFMSSLPMASHLVAFVISDFDSISTSESRNLSTWAQQQKPLDADGALGQEVAVKALGLLAEFSGVVYQLPKMDDVAIPDPPASKSATGWGLATYSERDLLAGPDASVRDVERIATEVCRKLALQWTGGLVTPAFDWTGSWLDEGFATFVGTVACAQIRPDWNLEDKMVPGHSHVAMEGDAQGPKGALGLQTDEEGKLAVVAHARGAAVLRMFYHALTPEVFKKGMKSYLSVNMFKSTTPDHLFRALGAAAGRWGPPGLLPAGRTFAELARTWTEQAGVPVLNAVRDYDKHVIEFDQRPFLYQDDAVNSSAGSAWWIPVTVASQARPDWAATRPKFWLGPADQQQGQGTMTKTEAGEHQWVLVNPGQTGYYRVNYDARNWRLLCASFADFPAATRAQLVGDALTLARAGALDYGLALPFLATLRTERGVAAWQAGRAAVLDLEARLVTSEARAPFLRLLADMTADAYDVVGLGVRASDPHETRYLRLLTAELACRAGHPACLRDAARALDAWLADPRGNALHPDVRSSALCYGLRGPDRESSFKALVDVWLAEEDNEAWPEYVAGLACASNTSLVWGLIDDLNHRRMNSDDTFPRFSTLISAVRARPENHKLLLDYMMNSTDSLGFLNEYGVEVLSLLIADIRDRDELGAVRRSVEKMEEWHQYYELHTAFATAEREMAYWHDKYYPTVKAWLEGRHDGGGDHTPSADADGDGHGGENVSISIVNNIGNLLSLSLNFDFDFNIHL